MNNNIYNSVMQQLSGKYTGGNPLVKACLEKVASTLERECSSVLTFTDKGPTTAYGPIDVGKDEMIIVAVANSGTPHGSCCVMPRQELPDLIEEAMNARKWTEAEGIDPRHFWSVVFDMAMDGKAEAAARAAFVATSGAAGGLKEEIELVAEAGKTPALAIMISKDGENLCGGITVVWLPPSIDEMLQQVGIIEREAA